MLLAKAFQAWKALTEAILALEKGKLEQQLTEKEKKWLEAKEVSWVPTSSLKPLSQLLEEKADYNYFSFYTDKALDLHTYQYQGPDTERILSEYASRKEAATDILLLLKVLVELVEEKIKARLQQKPMATRPRQSTTTTKTKTNTKKNGCNKQLSKQLARSVEDLYRHQLSPFDLSLLWN